MTYFVDNKNDGKNGLYAVEAVLGMVYHDERRARHALSLSLGLLVTVVAVVLLSNIGHHFTPPPHYLSVILRISCFCGFWAPSHFNYCIKVRVLARKRLPPHLKVHVPIAYLAFSPLRCCACVEGLRTGSIGKAES